MWKTKRAYKRPSHTSVPRSRAISGYIQVSSEFFMRVSLVCPLTLLFSAISAAQKPAEPLGFLVTSEWLARHLTDRELVVLEVDDAMDATRGHSHDKTTGHIPGAQYIAM